MKHEQEMLATRPATRTFPAAQFSTGEQDQPAPHLQRVKSLDEARLQAVLDVLPVGVCIADRQGCLTHMNAAARAIWGEQTPYASSFGQYHLYQGWWTRTGQAIAPEEWGMARAIQRGEVSIAEEIDILAFDSQRKTMLHYAAPIRDEAGSIIGGVVAILDITDRKQLEQALVERISQLEAVFEAMADGVFVYDQQGKIIQMNTAAGELLFPGVEDFPAHSLEERLALLTVRDQQGQMLSQQDWPIRRILHGEVLKERNAVDVLLRSLDGRELQVRISGAPMRDQQGSVIGAVGIVRDVSERHRVEQLERQLHAETQAHLALLQLILDELPGSVFLVRGSNARLLLANRAATSLWGASWQRGEPLEVFLSAHGIRLLGMDGQPLPPEQLAMLRVVKEGGSSCQQQEIIRHANGTTLPTLVNAIALDPGSLRGSLLVASQQGEEGDERVALVVYEDVTALKEAEALKDEFIGIAAHELRTPLAALQGFAQMLMIQTARGRGTELADWQLEALQEIEGAAFRLSELTEDLLDVTRLQAGRLALQREPTDLVALAQRVIKRLHMTSEQHTLTLHTTLSYLVVEADPHRLEQVLTNLIGNAIKYSPQSGPIEVTIEQRETCGAILSVRDHGIGIPAQQQGRIFSRFMRADNARTSGISGTGLGLYLCRELVELHGGRIWFESVEGQGSVFYLALPCPSQ
jgi:signal transduction histidine kinase